MPRTALALLALGLLLPGCGPGRMSQNELDRIRQAVEASLDSWKKGEVPSALAKRADPIEMADPEWGTHRLLGYQIKNVESTSKTKARCLVDLSLKDRQGKKVEREVAYDIDVANGTKIGRDAFY